MTVAQWLPPVGMTLGGLSILIGLPSGRVPWIGLIALVTNVAVFFINNTVLA